MKLLHVTLPDHSLLNFASFAEFVVNDKKGIVVDFENMERSSEKHLLDYCNRLTGNESFVIRCNFPSMFILDVVFLISVISHVNPVLLSTENITSKGFQFLRKMGLSGLASDRFYLHSSIAQPTSIVRSEIPHESAEFLTTLTATEITVLYLISLGLSNSQISDFTFRSYHTIKNHKMNIVRKIGLHHCNDLFEFIQRLKLSLL